MATKYFFRFVMVQMYVLIKKYKNLKGGQKVDILKKVSKSMSELNMKSFKILKKGK